VIYIPELLWLSNHIIKTLYIRNYAINCQTTDEA